jgi:hypothetical protein
MTHWTILENEWKEDGHRPVSWQRGLDIKHSAENSGLWTSHEKLLESDICCDIIIIALCTDSKLA